jgi:hypothetical protein
VRGEETRAQRESPGNGDLRSIRVRGRETRAQRELPGNGDLRSIRVRGRETPRTARVAGEWRPAVDSGAGSGDGTGGDAVVDHIRLFPLRDDARWTYRVHEQIFCSFDQGIYGHLTRRNLAALSTECGDHAKARRLWADVLAECPGDREALAKLERLRSALIGP